MVFILSLFLPYLPSPWAVRYFSSSLTVSCCNVPFRDMSSQSYSLYVFRSRLLLSVCLCVIIEIRQAIERLEADRTASRKKEDNQPKLTAFCMSTCSNSKNLDGDTDSEFTSTSSTNNDSDCEIA